MSLPFLNILYLTVSDIYPRQDFQTQSHYNKVKGLNEGQTMMLHTYNPNQCPNHV